NHKCTRGLGPQLQFSHDVPSSACLMIFNKECSKRINHKVCRALQAVSPLQCAENPMQAPVAFKDFHVSVLTEEDGVIEVLSLRKSYQSILPRHNHFQDFGD
uniref:Uncharacterized protein n=1 Tax=Aegilops tauschii subsp. strangulata TaxID=200361 RepID=A0A453LBH1_AEGTS